MARAFSGLRITADLVESDFQIERLIMKAFYEEFAKKVKFTGNGLTSQAQIAIRLALYEQPEYQSLASQGKLAKALGLPDGANSIEYVVDMIANSVKVDVDRPQLRRNSIVTGLTIAVTIDPDQLIEQPEAQVETRKGESLPWLRWLLKEGDLEFITGYKIYYAPIPKPRSRSGGAIMVEDEKSNWGVPPEFAGTDGDNFITRALVSAKEKVDKFVEIEMRKAFE